MKMLSEIAVKQQTDALNVINRLPKFFQSLELKSTSQALNTTLNLFKQSMSDDPLNALKDCGGFIRDVGTLGGNSKGIVDEFNTFFSNAQDAVENLKQFIENVQEHGSDVIKGKLASLKDNLQSNPFASLQQVGKVLANVDLSDFDVMSSCGTFNKGSKLEVTPNKALTSLQGFMEGYTQGLENSSDDKKLEQGKLFRQALMLLASPNGIALTTPEDILLQASQDIAGSAQGSINFSAQKNIVAHAQDKISLFAAQKGLSAYAAKGKVQIQAQDDAIEAIAKKVIKLISTEDKIEITSPKEIVLTAGGSQLKVNASGVFVTTGGKFESKAGQHIFSGGAAVNAELPKMPESGIFSRRFDFGDIFSKDELKHQVKFKFINHSRKTEFIGILDEFGRTQRFFSDSADNVEAIILGHDSEDLKELIVIKNDVEDTTDHSACEGEGCCGAADDHGAIEDQNESCDEDLEADFGSFGQ